MDCSSRKRTVWQSLDRILPSVLCWRVIECRFLPTMACFSWKGKSFREPGEYSSINPSKNPSEKPSVNPNKNPSMKQSKNPSKNPSENPNNCKCHNQKSHKHHNCQSHNLFNASSSTASPKTKKPPEKRIPQLVQCKSNSYNCKSHNNKSLHVPLLSFFMFHNYYSSCSTTIILLLSNKDLGGRGRSEEKGFHAVNSKRKTN